MKKDTHPKYQKVLFIDSSTGHKFVCGSTLQTDETEEFEGQKYPVYRVSISSSSHPLFTGSKGKVIDTEGRVERFKNRYKAPQQAQTVEAQEGGKKKTAPRKKK